MFSRLFINSGSYSGYTSPNVPVFAHVHNAYIIRVHNTLRKSLALSKYCLVGVCDYLHICMQISLLEYLAYEIRHISTHESNMRRAWDTMWNVLCYKITLENLRKHYDQFSVCAVVAAATTDIIIIIIIEIIIIINVSKRNTNYNLIIHVAWIISMNNSKLIIRQTTNEWRWWAL